MKTVRVALSAIMFDAGTQVRAALDQDHVASIAEAMTAGASLPPIVLFHDGNTNYIGDGFHRFMAATRLEWREIDADVRAGGKADALWFALGANRTNGKNMTPADKRHAILLALQTWPDRSGRQIADQIGCSAMWVSKVKEEAGVNQFTPAARVTGKDGKSYPARRPAKTEKAEHPKAAQVREMVRAGESVGVIRKALHVNPNLVAQVRRDMGIETADRTRAGASQRRKDIRDMADRGYTSHQIASALGISRDGVAAIAKQEGIALHADRVMGKAKLHDANRIVERMVMDAENLTADVNLIRFADLDRSKIAGWLRSLLASRNQLGVFIRQLMKEQQNDGEAA